DPSAQTNTAVQNTNTLFGSMGGPTYASGSAMFPTYSKQASAVNATNQIQSVLPKYSPAATAASKPGPPAAASPSPAASEATNGADAFDKIKTDAAAAQNQNKNAWPTESSKQTSQTPGLESSQTQPGVSQTIQDYQAPRSGPSTASTSSGLTLEDQVAALELKVYGKKSTDQTLLQRIGQLETDSIGETRQGSMKERVDNLRKTISHN
ncbi:MAG: hypothetical protein K2X81_11045, partial [Candidatus Obscuribacterales bacterium]|nr:hypothetical protein [Candidatus Obscuribacterales bacterium]